MRSSLGPMVGVGRPRRLGRATARSRPDSRPGEYGVAPSLVERAEELRTDAASQRLALGIPGDRVLAGWSEREGRIASGVPGTRRALPSACPRRPPPGADRSGRLALIAWFDMTYLGGDPSRSGPCHRRGFRPRRAGRARPKPPNRSGRKRASRLDRGDGPGAGHLGSRDGYYGITPDPASAGPQGASSSSPSADIRSDRPSARSLSRSVFRVIPRSRAAWSLLPSVDPSTSGRRSRSRCWCASW